VYEMVLSCVLLLFVVVKQQTNKQTNKPARTERRERERKKREIPRKD
jgi:hypothetical protein